MSERVLLDTKELTELGDLMEHLHHRSMAIRTKLGTLRPGLMLETRWAPDAEAATRLQALLDAAEQALQPLPSACLSDERSLRRTAKLAKDADDGPERRLSREQVTSMLDSLGGTKSPEQLAVLEAQLLGGIKAATDRYVAPANRPEPDSPSSAGGATGSAAAVVSLARKQLGIREQGNNRTKFGKWYGMDGVPWCAIFVSWVFAKSGTPLPALQGAKGFAGVRDGAAELNKRGMLLQEPRVGSIWLHRGATWNSDHTGIVTKVHADGSFTTIEGNASDRVLERRHPASAKKSSFGFGWVFGR